MKKTLIEKLAIGVIVLVVIAIVISIFAYVHIAVILLKNPELIGESIGGWISRFVDGFNGN